MKFESLLKFFAVRAAMLLMPRFVLKIYVPYRVQQRNNNMHSITTKPMSATSAFQQRESYKTNEKATFSSKYGRQISLPQRSFSGYLSL